LAEALRGGESYNTMKWLARRHAALVLATAAVATARLLESFGHTDVIDLGDITTARGTEMLLAIWLRLMGTLNTPMFNFKIVR
jgi:hypothetical protein